MGYYVNEHGALVFRKFLLSDVMSVSTVIPTEVVLKGEGAVKRYVNEYVANVVQEKKTRIEERRVKIRALNMTLHASVGDLTLKGRVRYANEGPRSLFTVYLEEPKEYTGEKTVYGSYARAMRGARTFDDEGGLTKEACEEAASLLVEIYEHQKHAIKYLQIYHLAEKLNTGH